jgi:hypothetical protein
MDMMVQRPLVGAAIGVRLVARIAAGSLLGAACGWGRIDAIGDPVGAGASQDAGSGETQGSEAAGSDDATSPEAQGPDGATDDVAAPADGGDGGDGGASSLACGAVESPAQEWPFDSDVAGWTLTMDTGVVGALSWTGSAGNPSPGALEVEVTSSAPDAAADGAWAEYDTPLGNLSGRTVAAWVWLDSGPSPHLKLFVQTGLQYTWADNGTVDLPSHVWTCVSMPVSSPSYTNGPNYDPTSVVRLGFEMLASSPFRIYVDTVRYY